MRVRKRVRLRLQMLQFASIRCNDEPTGVQHLSVARSSLQLVEPDFLIPRPLVRIQPGPYSPRGHENRRRSGVSAYETARRPRHARNTKVAHGGLRPRSRI